MINITYAALHMRAQTEKSTFSCKDDCTLTKHTRRWTYSALRNFFLTEMSFYTKIFFLLKLFCSVRICWIQKLFWTIVVLEANFLNLPFLLSKPQLNHNSTQPNITCNAAPPAMPHRLQNPKWPPGGPKMSDGVGKGVYP